MFVITQGLLSNLDITQGYGQAVVPPTPPARSGTPTLTAAGWSNLFVPRPLGQLPRFSAPRHEFFGRTSGAASVEGAFSARSAVPRRILVEIPPSPLYHAFSTILACRVALTLTYHYRDRLRELLEQEEQDLMSGVL